MTLLSRSLAFPALCGLALALSACGSKPDEPGVAAKGADQADVADSGEAEADGPGAATPGGGGGITAIDAARSGASAGVLPDDDPGPSAYDLARAREDGAHERQPDTTPEPADADVADSAPRSANVPTSGEDDPAISVDGPPAAVPPQP
jgi:hypothetical protein